MSSTAQVVLNKPKNGKKKKQRLRQKNAKQAKFVKKNKKTKQAKMAKVALNTSLLGPVENRVDPRHLGFTSTLSNDQIMSNVNPSAVFETQMQASMVAGVGIGALSYAMGRGFAQFVSDPIYPFLSYVYLTQYILNRVTGRTSNISQVPYWLACIGNAFSPKKVKSQAGFTEFKVAVPQVTASLVAGTVMQLNYSQYPYRWTVGVPTGTIVNGLFHVLDTNQVYNEDDAIKAFESLFQFLASQKRTPGLDKMSRLVDPVINNRFLHDASAFGVTSPIPGVGFYDSGAPTKQIQLEVPIHMPVMAVVSPATDTEYHKGRAPRFTRMFGGDAVFLGGMAVGHLEEDQYTFKKPPTFHCFDFNEVVDTVAQVLLKVIENATKDTQFLDSITQNGGDFSVLTCPLTLQEVMLIIRGTLMNAFSDTQYMVQTMMPARPQGQDDSQFVAFACGQGTCSIPTATNMLLPEVIVENVRATTFRCNVGHRGGHADPAYYIPILGQYHGDVLDPADYVYSFQYTPIGGTTPQTVTIPVFKSNASLLQDIVDPKTKKKVRIAAPEVTVSMVDGSSSSGFLLINDPNALNALAAEWNKYLQSVSDFLWTLDSIGTDAGISSLCMNIVTGYWQPVNGGEKSLIDHRFGGHRTSVDNVYNLRQVVGYTTSQTPMKANWESVQNVWIAPSMKINDVALSGTDTTFQRMSVLQQEPIEIPASSASQVYTLSMKHNTLANLCVKTRNAESYALGDFFREQAKKGRGGILSSIAQAFAPVAVGALTNALGAIPY